jgi:hypothetical protein
MAMGSVERMASIEVDGKRVALSPEGVKSIRGTKEELGRKIREAIERSISE